MREVGGQLVRFGQQPDGVQDRLRLLDQVAVRAVMSEHAPAVAARLGGDADVLERGYVGEDVSDLVRPRDALLRNAVWRKAGDVVVAEKDPSRSRPQHPRQAI